MSRNEVPEHRTIRESFSLLTVDDLKPLVALRSGPVPGRKGELVERLAETMENAKEVRALYESLDDLGKKAVQEATHDPEGVLLVPRFLAKYGRSPDFGRGGRYGRDQQPTTLRWFFPRFHVLPTDLQIMLLSFVPEPPLLTVSTIHELPATVQRPHVNLGSYHRKPDEEEVQLHVRETARSALLNVKALLRLVDAGEVRVSDKTHRPTQATLKIVANVLADGDFYSATDVAEEDGEYAADLVIQAFAWPLLIQTAGLAQLSGTKLQLTPAGRKATLKPSQDVIRLLWEKWLKTTQFDEFNRVNAIKGQQGKGRGGLTAVAPRRQAVVDILEACPVKQWIGLDELFRLLKVQAQDFFVTRDTWKLYIGEQQYGSFGYDAHYTWETLQGRYVLAFLFEYAATLGLLDVAYLSPVAARNDYRDRWGTDDLAYLSRYDGLLYVRINALGAWCLGKAETYEPEVVSARPVLKVLPNLDVVASDAPLNSGDVLLLDRFAERSSESVWRLSAARIVTAVEDGLTVAELHDFLAAKSQDPLPQTVKVFLDDVQQKTSQLEDLGAARMIACKDAHVAQLLARDRRLRNHCQLAGEHHLVFRAAEEAAVRRGLRDLGYVLPPPR